MKRTPEFRHTLNLLRSLALILITGFTLPAYAQTTGSLKVIVTDQNGAVVKGAVIKATNLDTNESISANTDDAGVALLPGLRPGRYKVEAVVQGFKTAVQTDVQVTIDQTNTVAFTLAIEAARTFAQGLPAASATDVSEAHQELSSLPNINNDLTPLLQLVPGAVAVGPASLGR